MHLETSIGREIDHEIVRKETRARAHKLIAQEMLRPGVTDWLDQADEMKLRLAVASSSSRSWVTSHLRRLGIGERFEMFVCYEDVERHKPDPQPYLVATERLRVAPSEAMAVEDSAHGLRAAEAAGLWCVAVPNHVTNQSVIDLGHLRLRSLSDLSLRDAIEKISNRQRAGAEASAGSE
jgi:HAD superfamily hydrolase (TIGR01509 family)